MKRNIWFIMLLAAFATLAPAVSVAADSAAGKRRPGSQAAHRPVLAYMLAGCPDCAAFRSFLQQNGVQIRTRYTRERPVDLFPTVIYSDGYRDHGERTYARQVKLPKSLTLIETN